MKKIIIYTLSLLVLAACDTSSDPEMEVEKTYPVAGEWYVHEYAAGGSYGPYHLHIFNTAFSKDSVWISNIYDAGIVVKSMVKSDKTFAVADAVDYAGIFGTATLLNTKIIDTDSIYFDVILYDDAGEVADEFYIAGRRWTGLE